MSVRNVIILGVGGNCVDILETIDEVNRHAPERQFHCAGFLDDDPGTHGRTIGGAPVLGPLKASASYREHFFICGVGGPKNFWRRESIVHSTGIPDERFVSIVHPTASVSPSARLGPGCVIFQHVTITSNVQIGRHVLILPNTVISHDDVIGDFTLIAGGVCISGGVRVGRLCYLGTNSAIIGNITIGDLSMIGMGSVVLDDVASESTVAGNPARRLRQRPRRPYPIK